MINGRRSLKWLRILLSDSLAKTNATVARVAVKRTWQTKPQLGTKLSNSHQHELSHQLILGLDDNLRMGHVPCQDWSRAGYWNTTYSALRAWHTIDKIGRFCLPIKLANKNLLCVMQKLTNFVGQHRTRSIPVDKIGQLFWLSVVYSWS